MFGEVIGDVFEALGEDCGVDLDRISVEVLSASIPTGSPIFPMGLRGHSYIGGITGDRNMSFLRAPMLLVSWSSRVRVWSMARISSELRLVMLGECQWCRVIVVSSIMSLRINIMKVSWGMAV